MNVTSLDECVIARRRCIHAAIMIDAPLSKVWATIGSDLSSSRYASMVRKSVKENWSKIAGYEKVTYFSGRTCQRFIVTWSEYEGYDLNVINDQGEVTRMAVRLAALAPGKTEMCMTAYPPTLGQLPFPIDWCLFKIKVEPRVKRECMDLLSGIKGYIETESKVQQAQFGMTTALNSYQ